MKGAGGGDGGDGGEDEVGAHIGYEGTAASGCGAVGTHGAFVRHEEHAGCLEGGAVGCRYGLVDGTGEDTHHAAAAAQKEVEHLAFLRRLKAAHTENFSFKILRNMLFRERASSTSALKSIM